MKARTLKTSSIFFLALAALPVTPAKPQLVSQGLEGYISMHVPAPPEGYGYGVSLYATAWPLTEKPLKDFQIGLASIWIVPDNRKIDYPLLPHGTVARDNWPERGPSYRDVFQTIEGGLGFWGDTRYGSTTAKFRMNGTANGYNHMICSPGWGFGNFPNTQALKADQMGIAQLSNRILVPPDGFTFKPGTNGQLLGYAWMALPLTEPKQTPVATGNQCWTLFLNTQNAKGPVAFFTPVTWTRISQGYAPAIGLGLDTLPGLVTGGAIEVNTVPRYQAEDSNGDTFTSIPRLQFPVDAKGQTVLIHNLTQYSKSALYDQVEAWLQGGPTPSGRFETKGAVIPAVTANPLSLRQGADKLPIQGLDQIVQTKALDPHTFGLQWQPQALEPWQGLLRRGSFPQFFRQQGKQVQVIPESDVPKETGLTQAAFPTAPSDAIYTSPQKGDNCWQNPGPKAGPFQAKLSDGSVVTYYWYRFIDQPALQDAGLTSEEKQRLQATVEKIQKAWTLHKQYIPPPQVGALASLDPAMIVTPPKGLELGYVPIAVRQAPQNQSN